MIHPFAEAHDTTYAAPQNHNFGTAPKLPAVKKVEPVYHTQALIYDRKITTDIYDCVMLTSVTLTQCKLFIVLVT